MKFEEAYDIYLCRQGRWTIDFRAKTRADAEQRANDALTHPAIDGVRVVRDRFNPRTKVHREDTIFERAKAAPQISGLRLGSIETTPPCETVDALHQWPALFTINRLFASYLDRYELTVTEILHLETQLERARDTGPFFRDGMFKLASARAKTTDAGYDECHAHLERLIGLAGARARNAARNPLPKPAADGLDTALREIQAGGTDEASMEYMLRSAVATDLIDLPHRWAKLVISVAWARTTELPLAARVVDGVLADLLCQSTVIDELLGETFDFGVLLCQMIDLAAGQVQVAVEDDEELRADHPDFALAGLAELMRANKLPDTRAVLLERVRRELTGKQPLCRDPDRAWQQFDQVVQRLVLNVHVMGGPDMAAAIVRRALQFQEAGGATGLNRSVEPVLRELFVRPRQIGFAIALWESELAERIGGTLQKHIQQYMFDDASVNDLVPDAKEPIDRMRAMTTLHDRIHDAAIPEKWKAPLLGQIDRLLVRYIEDDGILERIDDSTEPLHVRAFMLVRICQPGVLPKGQAQALASDRILRHLRRPRFEQELVAGIPDPSLHERTVRDFHAELQQSVLIGA